MGGACGTQQAKRNTYRALLGERLDGKPRLKLEDYSEMGLKEMG
jgi:hypothetical protein